MKMPVFLKLTCITGEPVWINMAMVEKVTKTTVMEGSWLFFVERKQGVKESPEEIMQMLYSNETEDDTERGE
jgi:hypothetical protein